MCSDSFNNRMSFIPYLDTLFLNSLSSEVIKINYRLTIDSVEKVCVNKFIIFEYIKNHGDKKPTNRKNGSFWNPLL